MNNDILQSFFNDYHARFSLETVRSYKIALQQFFVFCAKPYDEVKAIDIRAWLASMEEEELKPRSIQLKLSAVKSFYKYCAEENMIKKNPALSVKTPKKEDSLPYYLGKHELTLLQELTKENVKDRAVVETLYATGVRISELLNIKLADVKWDSRQIWIRKGKGNKERFVLFSFDCAERLKAYLAQREVESEYLFCNQRGHRLNRGLVEAQFREYTELLGFKVTPHTMRHTFAAHLAEKHMDFSFIQELLGHENVNSTRIYTRLTNTARKKKYDQYHT